MKKARKTSSSKLGFEVGSGLKRSQSKYSHEGISKLYGVKKQEKMPMRAVEFGTKLGELTKKKWWLEKQRRTAIYYGNDGWRLKVEKQLRELQEEFDEMSRIAPTIRP